MGEKVAFENKIHSNSILQISISNLDKLRNNCEICLQDQGWENDIRKIHLNREDDIKELGGQLSSRAQGLCF